MTLYEIMRDDFKNLFLEECGEPVTVTRNNSIQFSQKAILDGNKAQFMYNIDIQPGDILFFTAHNQKALVTGISYEVHQGHRITLFASLEPIRS